MSPLIEDRSPAWHGPGVRPLVVGALACGALLMSAPAALAKHSMPNGTLCPHAAGEPVPGEAAPGPVPTSSTSAAPLAAARSSAPPATKPAAKPSPQAKAQKPASQAQAQQPATSQAQAQRPAQAQVQRPAVASRPAAAPVTARASSPATVARPVPVARSAKAGAGKARTAAKRTAPAHQTAQRPAVHPDNLRPAAPRVTNPTVSSVDAGQPASPAIGTLLLALLALGGIATVAAMALIRRRTATDAERIVGSPTSLDERDAAIEAELQAMISETRARAPRLPDGPEQDAGDARVLSATR